MTKQQEEARARLAAAAAKMEAGLLRPAVADADPKTTAETRKEGQS
jgi:hypothetical protein